MDRTEFLLTATLIVVVLAGAFFNAYRVQKSEFLPVVVDEQPVGGIGPKPKLEDRAGSASSWDVGPLEQAEEVKKNINAATVEDLASVGGIGEALAGQIVKYRNVSGLFRSMANLDKVPGIGRKRVELLSQYFEVKGAPPLPDVPALNVSPVDDQLTFQPIPRTTTDFSPGVWRETPPFSYTTQPVMGETRLININFAWQEELESLPEIGEVLARRIIEDRVKNGPFLQKQDIMRVHGIGEKTYQKIEPWITVGY